MAGSLVSSIFRIGMKPSAAGDLLERLSPVQYPGAAGAVLAVGRRFDSDKR
jgi:hypothetical protein